MRYYSSSGMLWPTRRRYGRLLFVFATIVCISFRSWITVASMNCLWTQTRKEYRLLQVGKRDEVAFLVLTLSCMLLIHAFNASAWTRAISLLYEEKSVCFHLPRKLRAETRRKQHRRLATLHLISLFMYVLHERLKIALNCARIILGDKTYSPPENGHYLFNKLSYSIILPLFY